MLSQHDAVFSHKFSSLLAWILTFNLSPRQNSKSTITLLCGRTIVCSADGSWSYLFVYYHHHVRRRKSDKLHKALKLLLLLLLILKHANHTNCRIVKTCGKWAIMNTIIGCRQTWDRQTGEQTYRQTDRQRDWQTEVGLGSWIPRFYGFAVPTRSEIERTRVVKPTL